MVARLVLVAPAVIVMAGCGVLDQLAAPPAVVAEFVVFNRTEADIVYVSADGERLDVPACGRASDPTFRIDDVRVRTDAGYIRGFGSAVPELAGQQVFVVELSRAMDSGVPELGDPPDPLPPCAGRPEVQHGN
jgi:hypothetical protein